MTEQALGPIVMSYVFDFFLNNNVMIIGACVFGTFLLEFKEEYFPRKARGYELAGPIMELNLRRKYLCKTSKYLKNLNLRTRY